MRSVPAVLLTGTAGAGKTAVAREIGDLLRQAGVRHAVIDLDALGEVDPPSSEDDFNASFIAGNLAAIWPNYRAHGVERLIMARVVGSPGEIETYSEAIPEAEITVCRVDVPERTVAERLDEREAGDPKDFLVEISANLDKRASELALEDFTVRNDGDRAISDVALDVMRHLGWPVPDEKKGPAR